MPQREHLSFGANLLVCRLHSGFSQVELAERSGLSQAYIAGMESGRDKNPSLDAICRLAAALGIDPAALVVCPATEVA